MTQSSLDFKRWALSLLLCCCSALSSAITEKSCALGANGSERVVVTRNHPIADTWQYSLSISGKTEAIWGAENDGSRGASVQVQCIGKKEKVLLIRGEFFAAAYPKGLLLRYFNRSKTWQRIEFAERLAPIKLYLGQTDTILVFPNQGPEYSLPFVSYQAIMGKELPASIQASKTLPKTRGYQVFNLNQSQQNRIR